MPSPTLILASTSPYRRALLERLRLPFVTIRPGTEETRQADERADDMVQRLAQAKAHAIAQQHPDAWVIGSDQCAVLGEQILGKPHTHERAVEQLKAASGQAVIFHTGLCLMHQNSGFCQVSNSQFNVQFRQLSDTEIEHYLRAEQPYDCAGSFKSEGLGVALFESMRGDDPSSLIGLPLISLCAMLRDAGINPLRQV